MYDKKNRVMGGLSYKMFCIFTKNDSTYLGEYAYKYKNIPPLQFHGYEDVALRLSQ